MIVLEEYQQKVLDAYIESLKFNKIRYTPLPESKIVGKSVDFIIWDEVDDSRRTII